MQKIKINHTCISLTFCRKDGRLHNAVQYSSTKNHPWPDGTDFYSHGITQKGFWCHRNAKWPRRHRQANCSNLRRIPSRSEARTSDEINTEGQKNNSFSNSDFVICLMLKKVIKFSKFFEKHNKKCILCEDEAQVNISSLPQLLRFYLPRVHRGKKNAIPAYYRNR